MSKSLAGFPRNRRRAARVVAASLLLAQDRLRLLAPLLTICCLLVYQARFFFALVATLYWGTPLSSPFVKGCLMAQMVFSLLLIVFWSSPGALTGRIKPDLPERWGRRSQVHGVDWRGWAVRTGAPLPYTTQVD